MKSIIELSFKLDLIQDEDKKQFNTLLDEYRLKLFASPDMQRNFRVDNFKEEINDRLPLVFEKAAINQKIKYTDKNDKKIQGILNETLKLNKGFFSHIFEMIKPLLEWLKSLLCIKHSEKN